MSYTTQSDLLVELCNNAQDHEQDAGAGDELFELLQKAAEEQQAAKLEQEREAEPGFSDWEIFMKAKLAAPIVAAPTLDDDEPPTTSHSKSPAARGKIPGARGKSPAPSHARSKSPGMRAKSPADMQPRAKSPGLRAKSPGGGAGAWVATGPRPQKKGFGRSQKAAQSKKEGFRARRAAAQPSPAATVACLA